MNRTVPTLGLLLALVMLTACSANQPAPASSPTADLPTVTVASLRGPTTMGLVKLMDDSAAGLTASPYEFSMHGTADEIVPLIVQGKVDIALVPANLAAVLYQRTAGTEDQIAVLAINTLGVLTVVETGSTIESIADLRGRTVYSTGKGTTPEHVLNYLLGVHGLVPGTDVTVVYKSEATEVAAVLATDPAAIGVLPQPYVTALQGANPDVRIALDLTDEWDAVSGDSQLVTGVAVVRAAFAAEHPDAVARFLTDYQASIAFTNDHPDRAAPLIVAAGIAPTDDVAERAIPLCHVVFIDGAAMQTILSGYLEVLFTADPAAVGGGLPGDDFYYDD